jgi:hypothetical protein
MPGAGGSVAVRVTTQQGCGWTFQGNEAWISAVPAADGTTNPGNGSGGVVLQVALNPGQRRTGTATIAYHTVIVDQAGINGSACTFQVVPTSVQAPSAGGSGRSTVIPSSENCGWFVDHCVWKGTGGQGLLGHRACRFLAGRLGSSAAVSLPGVVDDVDHPLSVSSLPVLSPNDSTWTPSESRMDR